MPTKTLIPKHEKGYWRAIIGFVSPVVIFFTIFQIYPLLKNVWLSFTSVSGGFTLNSYSQVLTSQSFWQSTWITVSFSLISVSIEMFVGFIFALLLNQEFRGRKALRTIFLIPWALPTAIMATGWKFLLQHSYGPIPWLLYWLHLTSTPPYFLSTPKLAFISIIMADAWKTVPFCALLLLAGLQAIPQDLYEAMQVDGAGWFFQLRKLTIPLMIPAIVVTLMFRFLQAFGVFDLIWVLTNGGPGNATMALSPYIYQQTFNWLDVRAGAATSVMMAIYILILVVVVWLTRSYIGRRYAQ
ncbi:carbohydrate ABC transporter permease [Mesoaciditoga lauensis]|uniref:carbohydrate ABC transporter permease n=1 Tax=Mesoaciditoga lauensis TaxID=1495039 RepID=UPI0009DE0384|nr:sugar ABC transporter permease [Mesoaciditoga lauensis]